jgi:hypothetical protein
MDRGCPCGCPTDCRCHLLHVWLSKTHQLGARASHHDVYPTRLSTPRCLRRVCYNVRTPGRHCLGGRVSRPMGRHPFRCSNVGGVDYGSPPAWIFLWPSPSQWHFKRAEPLRFRPRALDHGSGSSVCGQIPTATQVKPTSAISHRSPDTSGGAMCLPGTAPAGLHRAISRLMTVRPMSVSTRQESSSRSAFASCKSAVSNPSMNQP